MKICAKTTPILDVMEERRLGKYASGGELCILDALHIGGLLVYDFAR
jgi:hypothetical protein